MKIINIIQYFVFIPLCLVPLITHADYWQRCGTDPVYYDGRSQVNSVGQTDSNMPTDKILGTISPTTECSITNKNNICIKLDTVNNGGVINLSKTSGVYQATKTVKIRYYNPITQAMTDASVNAKFSITNIADADNTHAMVFTPSISGVSKMRLEQDYGLKAGVMEIDISAIPIALKTTSNSCMKLDKFPVSEKTGSQGSDTVFDIRLFYSDNSMWDPTYYVPSGSSGNVSAKATVIDLINTNKFPASSLGNFLQNYIRRMYLKSTGNLGDFMKVYTMMRGNVQTVGALYSTSPLDTSYGILNYYAYGGITMIYKEGNIFAHWCNTNCVDNWYRRGTPNFISLHEQDLTSFGGSTDINQASYNAVNNPSLFVNPQTPQSKILKTLVVTFAAEDVSGWAVGSQGQEVTFGPNIVISNLQLPNTAPTAVNNSYTINEDTPITVTAPGILANDSDPEGSALTAQLVTSPSNGIFSFNANGSFTFIPNANWNGTTSFTYKVSDGSLTSNTATVTIIVNPINDAPVAVNDTYSTNEDTPLTISVPGVLANDSDLEGTTLTAQLVSTTANGSVTLKTSGLFTFTPNANWNGITSFTYKASDGSLASNTATVTITVIPVNDPPFAVNDVYITNEDIPLTVTAPGILANDSDPEGSVLTAQLVTSPSNGIFSFNTNGGFTFIPNANWNGTTSFTYKASDGSLTSNTATVDINVLSEFDNNYIDVGSANIDFIKSGNMNKGDSIDGILSFVKSGLNNIITLTNNATLTFVRSATRNFITSIFSTLTFIKSGNISDVDIDDDSFEFIKTEEEEKPREFVLKSSEVVFILDNSYDYSLQINLKDFDEYSYTQYILDIPVGENIRSWDISSLDNGPLLSKEEPSIGSKLKIFMTKSNIQHNYIINLSTESAKTYKVLIKVR